MVSCMITGDKHIERNLTIGILYFYFYFYFQDLPIIGRDRNLRCGHRRVADVIERPLLDAAPTKIHNNSVYPECFLGRRLYCKAQADRASVVQVTSSYNNSHKLGHFGHLKIIIGIYEFTGCATASVHVFDKIRCHDSSCKEQSLFLSVILCPSFTSPSLG
jgi:hypothetical protein